MTKASSGSGTVLTATSPALSIQEYSFCSVTAGLISKITLFPLDTVKTRLQYYRSRAQGDKFSARDAILKFIKREGVAGLYRGITGALIGVLPYSILYMPSYEFFKAQLQVLTQIPVSMHHTIAGAMAGLCGSVVRVPIELLKKRLQVGMYKSFLESARKTFQEGGIRAFYSGYRSALLYDVPYNAIQFSVLERTKKFLLRMKRSEVRKRNPNAKESDYPKSLEGWDNVVLGGLTGMITSLFTEPMDVIRTRLMTQRSLLLHPNTVAYKGIVDCLVTIVKEEGVLALWKGTLPRLFWVSLGSSVWYSSYEFFRKRLITRKAKLQQAEQEQKQKKLRPSGKNTSMAFVQLTSRPLC